MGVIFEAADISRIPKSGTLLIENSSLILCDLDGCLAEDNVPLIGAVEFVNRYAKKLCVLSNNSSDMAENLAKELRMYGLDINESCIFLAGEIGVHILAKRYAGARAMVFGSKRIQMLADSLGLTVTDMRPDVIFLAREGDVSIHRLQTAFDAIGSGAPLFVANPDVTRPGRNNRKMIETGAVLSLFLSLLPEAELNIIGKPYIGIYEFILNKYSCPPEQAVMIGDTFDTDISGAINAGANAIWLKEESGS